MRMIKPNMKRKQDFDSNLNNMSTTDIYIVDCI